MPDLSYPLIDGVRHDWTSTETKIAGQIFIGMKNFKWSRKRTRGWVEGAHPDPIAKTTGTNKYTASCEMPLAEWYMLKQLLVNLAAAQGVLGQAKDPVIACKNWRLLPSRNWNSAGKLIGKS